MEPWYVRGVCGVGGALTLMVHIYMHGFNNLNARIWALFDGDMHMAREVL